MRQAYLDCSSGISGDMFLGVLLDAGASAQRLLEELRKIPLGFYELRVTRALRGGLVGERVQVHVPDGQPARRLSDIEALLGQASLPGKAQQQALRVFRRLAEAEGRLHNQPAETVHFHEVGAVDAIIDIVGVCVGMELLEISELIASPLNVGGGRVEAAHGSLPVPAPATAELLKGAPIYSSGVEGELVTPTGAGLVSTLAAGFGPLPPFVVERIGYGAGEREIPGHPNMARLFVGQRLDLPAARPGPEGEELISILEANVDDMSPQLYGYFQECAFAAGALDVTCSSIQMKKNRPGLTVTVLAKPELSETLAQLLFEQTTTIGVRIYEARRKVLDRERVPVETPYGAVHVKVARRNGRVVNIAPEYEDCQRLATEKSVPLKQVILAAEAAFLKLNGQES